MSSDEHRIRMPFTIFRSAADEIAHKVASDEAAHSPIVEERRDDEGGHMSSTSGSVRHVPGSALPFIATLGHDQCDATDHPFATMREAEAFIRRNTPVPANALATTYDWAPLDPRSASAELESTIDDETILTSLKAIDERLRQMSAADAASVLAGSMVQAGLRKHERLQLIAEMERILDELEGEVGDKPRAFHP
jgi:hypothetical protein